MIKISFISTFDILSYHHNLKILIIYIFFLTLSYPHPLSILNFTIYYYSQHITISSYFTNLKSYHFLIIIINSHLFYISTPLNYFEIYPNYILIYPLNLIYINDWPISTLFLSIFYPDLYYPMIIIMQTNTFFIYHKSIANNHLLFFLVYLIHQVYTADDL
jgi:hypothetical protein